MRRVLAPLLLLVTGCGAATVADLDDATTEVEGAQSTGDENPPEVVVSSAGDELALPAWTTCWINMCYDGAPPDPLAELGDIDDDLTVTFPRAGWAFDVTAVIGDLPCADYLPAKVEAIGDTSWRITPSGPAGTYRFDVFGRGPEGDVIVSFAATTTTDRPMPEPIANAHTFYWVDGEPETDEDFALTLEHVTEAPDEATATLTVTTADGRVSSHDMALVVDECRPRGQVTFRGPAPHGQVLEEIGPPPFELNLAVVLDGVLHSARASWPDDMDEETWFVGLAFGPPLQ